MCKYIYGQPTATRQAAGFFRGLEQIHDKKPVLDTSDYSFVTRKTGFRDKAMPVWGKLLFAPLAVMKTNNGSIDWSSALGFGHILDSGDDPLIRYVCVGFLCLHNGGPQSRKYILLHVTVTPKGQTELKANRLSSYELYPFRLFDLKMVLNDQTGSLPPAVGHVTPMSAKRSASDELFLAQVPALFTLGGYLHSEYILTYVEVS